MIIPKEHENREITQTFQYRRMPAVPRKITEINPETDIRVRLLGKVIAKYDGMIILDDGSGKAEIVMEEDFDKVDADDVVRIFCRVLPLENGYELRAELVQDMRQLDLDLHKKIH